MRRLPIAQFLASAPRQGSLTIDTRPAGWTWSSMESAAAQRH
jgi:hypothetical protein